MGTNLPTYNLDASLVRSGEVTAADWSGGMNKGGSNAPGVGINTGNYDPKASDWPRIEDTAAHESQHIGQTADDLNVVQDADVNDEVAFVQADASTAADGVLDVATGAVNKTGATVPEDAWCWGVIPVA
jgi:hypothetical protein